MFSHTRAVAFGPTPTCCLLLLRQTRPDDAPPPLGSMTSSARRPRRRSRAQPYDSTSAVDAHTRRRHSAVVAHGGHLPTPRGRCCASAAITSRGRLPWTGRRCTVTVAVIPVFHPRRPASLPPPTPLAPTPQFCYHRQRRAHRGSLLRLRLLLHQLADTSDLATEGDPDDHLRA
jgi:hypothetical protein